MSRYIWLTLCPVSLWMLWVSEGYAIAGFLCGIVFMCGVVPTLKNWTWPEDVTPQEIGLTDE